MSGMPYVFEQGLVLSVLDSYFADEERAVASLRWLRPQTDGSLKPLTGGPGFAAGMLGAIVDPVGPSRTTSAAAHVDSHWFGRSPDGGGETVGAGEPWWQGWSGDAEGIARWTMISALEVSLGVDHVGPERYSSGAGEPVRELPVEPTRFWPIHLYWSCGSPLFQGWVGWHRHGPARTEGIVNVVFATPGTGKPMFATPHAPAGHGGPPRPGAEDPASTIGDHGLWVIGQHETVRTFGRRVREPLHRPVGSGLLPDDVYYGVRLASRGDVCIVAPSERNGGVLPGGRPYERTRPT
jgi:hypothetical protein